MNRQRYDITDYLDWNKPNDHLFSQMFDKQVLMSNLCLLDSLKTEGEVAVDVTDMQTKAIHN